MSGGASMAKLEKFGSKMVFKRPGQPAELASLYVQLAAAGSSLQPDRCMDHREAPASRDVRLWVAREFE
jgi:hypothetical protein